MTAFSYYGVKWTQHASVRYDEKTVTVSDYTLFFRIDKQQNKIFNELFYNPDEKDKSVESRGT